jgi:hypothetical protein
MKEDMVKARWAREAVAAINAAVEDWNARHPRAQPLRIVWGYRHAEETELEAAESARYRFQQGLLSYRGLDVEISINRHCDPDHPNPCHFTTTFEFVLRLPTAAPLLYNCFRCLEDGVKLRLLPESGDERVIAVLGVETTIPVEGVTGRILGDALSRLSMSHSLAWDRISRDKGDDHWGMDGGS